MLFKEVARKIWNSQRDHLEGWDGFEVAINKLSEEQLIQLDLEMSDIVERALNRMMSKMFAGND